MSPELTAYALWLLWLMSWGIAAFWSAPTVKQPSSRALWFAHRLRLCLVGAHRHRQIMVGGRGAQTRPYGRGERALCLGAPSHLYWHSPVRLRHRRDRRHLGGVGRRSSHGGRLVLESAPGRGFPARG